MIKHKGKKVALVAIARKILVAGYFILKRKEKYKEPVVHKKNQQKEIKRHLKKLEELGVTVTMA